MRTIPEERCPSSACQKSYRDPLRPLQAQGLSGLAWLDELTQKMLRDPEHLTDQIFECPYCKVVWTQPSNFSVGFRAELRGYNRGNPERLEPVAEDLRAIDPPVRRVAEGRPKRSATKR